MQHVNNVMFRNNHILTVNVMGKLSVSVKCAFWLTTNVFSSDFFYYSKLGVGEFMLNCFISFANVLMWNVLILM